MQILVFNFQLDETGRPWLSSIRGDHDFASTASQNSNTQTANSFNDLKAHMINEVVKVIERKVKQQRELLFAATYKPDVTEVLREATSLQQVQTAADMTLMRTRNALIEKERALTRLVDVMKVIPLYQVPQSYLYYKNTGTTRGRFVRHKVIDNGFLKEKQYWAQIAQWVREAEPPSEDIFLNMISKRLYDKRVYTGVSGKYSFVQSIISQSNNDFR